MAVNTKKIEKMIEYKYSYIFPNFPQITFKSNIIDEKQLEERSTIILKYIEKSQKAVQFLNQALKKGRLSVLFCDGEAPAGASVQLGSRQINIHHSITNSFKLLDYFIFELCNLNNEKMNQKQLVIAECLDKKSYDEFIKNFPDADSYSERIEYSEWFSHNTAAEIFQDGICTCNWPIPEDRNELRVQISWQKYWERANTYDGKNFTLEKLSHRQSYILQYYKLARQILVLNIRSEKDLEKWIVLTEALSNLQKEQEIFLSNTEEQGLSLLTKIIKEENNQKQDHVQEHQTKKPINPMIFSDIKRNALIGVTLAAASFLIKFVKK